jgi:choline kinase
MIENAIILAAGTGSRLKPLTDHAPKCLTEINGTPILIQALNNLIVSGIKECIIVTGHFSESIRNVIGINFKGLNIRYIYNRYFAKTNDMYSLWLARGVLQKGCVLLEGDIYFRSETLKNALSEIGEESCYIGGRYNGKKDEILISTDPNKLIQSIRVLRGVSGEKGKDKYMSSGMLVIQKSFGKIFSQWLTEFVDQKLVDVLFDDVLSTNIKAGKLYVFEIQHTEWVEIDTKNDVKRAEIVFRK